MTTQAHLKTALAGRYSIEREIGAGGMATVYLARDVRHDRNVALKVLRPELGAVLGVERFLAEIKVTANLQHPNLLPLFDSGEAGGLLFYVMPFVQGESLRRRLEREKQLPIDDAVRIACAVGSALDYAHRHGVIHRDLKPENILLHEGQPLVADFGIALAVSNAGGNRVTQTGLSLGTPQYMSPEQATGDRDVDGRADLYSLGAMLYEMLTGEAPHIGNTAQAIIARVLTEKPRPVRASRPNVPPHVEAAVDRALEKLPADRFATAHELVDALQGRGTPVPARADAATVATPAAMTAAPDQGALRRLRRAAMAASGIAIIAVAAAAWGLLRPPAAEPPATTRFALNFEPGERVADNLGSGLAISPDGRTLVYTASREGRVYRLYVRPIGDLHARELTGTDGAYQPTFSPDGRWIAFVTGAQLKKVQLEGGTPVTLSSISAASVRGLSWSERDTIVVGLTDDALMTISAAGGTPRRIRTEPAPRPGQSQRWPLVLPGGRDVIFVHQTGATSSAELWITSIVGGAAHSLGVKGTAPLGLIDDQLIYVDASGAVTAVRYDVDAQRTTASPVPTGVDGVTVDAVASWARASLSATGSLLYQSGATKSELVLAGPTGRADPVRQEAENYGFPRFSPNGNRIALTRTSGSGTEIWIYDRTVGTLERLTSGDGISNDRPEWSPDGKRVIFRSTREGTAVWWQPADRSGPAEPLVKLDSVSVNEGIVSPDGEWVLFRANGGSTIQDLWARRLKGDTTILRFVTTPAYETGARFSPDGHWVAYSSDESALRQVYVTPFPGPGPQHQVSIAGGQEPVWGRDGRHLYYVNGRQVISATVTLSPTFGIIAQDSVYEGSFASNYVHANYDVTADGKRFLVLRTTGDVQVIAIHDWLTELRARLSPERSR